MQDSEKKSVKKWKKKMIALNTSEMQGYPIVSENRDK